MDSRADPVTQYSTRDGGFPQIEQARRLRPFFEQPQKTPTQRGRFRQIRSAFTRPDQEDSGASPVPRRWRDRNRRPVDCELVSLGGRCAHTRPGSNGEPARPRYSPGRARRAHPYQRDGDPRRGAHELDCALSIRLRSPGIFRASARQSTASFACNSVADATTVTPLACGPSRTLPPSPPAAGCRLRSSPG